MTRKADRRSTVMIVEDDLEASSMARGMVEGHGLDAVGCAIRQAAHDHLTADADDVLAMVADVTLRDSVDGVALDLTTAKRFPWTGICVISGRSALRPEVPRQKMRFIS